MQMLFMERNITLFYTEWNEFDQRVFGHIIINPRRACAARVTVVVLCVSLFVCLSTTILVLQATRRLMSDTNSFSATRAWKLMCMAILLKRLRSRDMANMHNQHWLTSTRFSPFSVPWTKGLCIQSSAALNPLTITHAASPAVRGRPLTALRGPA